MFIPIMHCHLQRAMHIPAPEITLGSTATRSKPNAFNHLHQLRRRQLLGQSIEAVLQQWKNPKTLRDIYGLGPLEAAAVVNLVDRMPHGAVQQLEKAACRYGMVKGPISHGGRSTNIKQHDGLALCTAGVGWHALLH